MTQREALFELAKRRAKTDLLSFLQFVWWMPFPLVLGRHTVDFCNRLTRAVDDWLLGKSSYIIALMPFRHGKSDIASIALPAFFLGRCAYSMPDVIMTGYGADLVQSFSRKCKSLIASPRYRELFPDVRLNPKQSGTDKWSVAGSMGTVTVAGLGGAITGHGGHLIVLDDYCKSYAESRSKTYRDRTANAFFNDLFSRQNNPASIVVVTATPWSVDDIVARIARKEAESRDFPRFDKIVFPARGNDYDYLCEALHSREWYDAMRESLGKQQAAALLDCNPIPDAGDRFDINKIMYFDDISAVPSSRQMRGWDLASSKADNNADRTWGVKGCIVKKRDGIIGVSYELWITDLITVEQEAQGRNALMRETALNDGSSVVQVIESFGAYKDAYTQLRDALSGVAIVKKSQMKGDKESKLASLEPVWDSGNVHVYRGVNKRFLELWLAEFQQFPNGLHDDACDATGILFNALKNDVPRALI